MSEPLLRIEELEVHFPIRRGVVWSREVGRIRAVNGVSLAVPPGAVLALVGESGCGKSTLARAVLQLIRPTGGHVWYGGRDLAALRSRELREAWRELQLVFQDPFASLNPRLKVGQIVAEPLVNFGLARGRAAQRRAAELLKMVGLGASCIEGYPHQFSGGQRQRIAIARALAPEPKILFCDEPVSALDVSIQAQVIQLIRRLKDELGLTVVFISHDLSVVRTLADRVAVMYLGRIVELAPVAKLYDQPLHPYTQALLSAVPIPDPVAERQRERRLVQGEPPLPEEERAGCDFASRCPFARDRCRAERPPLAAHQPDHHAACFYTDEIQEILT